MRVISPLPSLMLYRNELKKNRNKYTCIRCTLTIYSLGLERVINYRPRPRPIGYILFFASGTDTIIAIHTLFYLFLCLLGQPRSRQMDDIMMPIADHIVRSAKTSHRYLAIGLFVVATCNRDHKELGTNAPWKLHEVTKIRARATSTKLN